MKIDLNLIEDYIEKNLISKKKHPIHDLWIYNYTRECQYGRKWDDITISCRGLITDNEGNIIARPFGKFFNYGEIIDIPSSNDYKIYKKLDGSLIIVCMYKGDIILSTRGSFESDQAFLASNLLDQNTRLRNFIKCNGDGFTWLFELTGPDNRIVVNYEFNELTLLTVIHNEKNDEMDLDSFRKYDFIKVVEEYVNINKNIENLQRLDKENEEGFVLKWKDGFRLKIKFFNYLKLHRIITGLNERVIWEQLKDEKDIECLIQELPEELHTWLIKISTTLKDEFNRIYNTCIEYILINNLFYLSRKEAAIKIMEDYKKYSGVLFNLLDNREEEARKVIWNIIKPGGNSE